MCGKEICINFQLHALACQLLGSPDKYHKQQLPNCNNNNNNYYYYYYSYYYSYYFYYYYCFTETTIFLLPDMMYTTHCTYCLSG